MDDKSGGQYTQRWALLSNSTAFTTTTRSTDNTTTTTTTMVPIIKKPSIRVIVANPKAFAYLDNRRFIVEEQEEKNHHQDDVSNSSKNSNNNSTTSTSTMVTTMTFRIPDEQTLQDCPDYDEWEWGLAKTRQGYDDVLPTPYKDRVIARAAVTVSTNGTYESGVQVLVERYGLQRHIIYLAGQLDVLPNGNYCQEQIQGDYRRQRSFRFFQSLSEIYNANNKNHHQQQLNTKLKHYRLVVHGVHHDHCLMFQSPEGQQAMFGNFHHDDDDDDVDTTMTTATS